MLLPAAVLFFLSGTAALVYQVAWQRMLALHTGLGVYSVALIVAAFMAGLGIGSHWGGVQSARLTGAQALRRFAWIELGIGAFAVASAPLYYDLLYLRGSWLYHAHWSAGLLHFASLLPPTLLMGMSLPLLVRALVEDARTAGRTIGVLYALNVLGASAGAFLTPWVFVRLAGLRGAVLAGAALNVAAGLGALLLARARRPTPETMGAETATPPVETAAASDVERAGAHPLRLWAGLYALSGFCSLALEILWFRIVDVAVKSTAFTFGTVLGIFLLGLGVGSLAGAVAAPRLRRPLRTFLLCQCAILLWAGAGVLLIGRLSTAVGPYAWFFDYFRAFDGFPLGRAWAAGPVLRLYVLLPLALYGLPTVLMGLSFPVLQRAVQDDPRTSGLKTGMLQAANIAGCVAGSLLVGLVAFGALGTTSTVRALLAVGLLFAALGARTYRSAAFVAMAVLLVATAVALPGQDRFWRRLHGLDDDEDALLSEDSTAVVAVRPMSDGAWGVSVNGQGHSWLPYGHVHTWIGAIPALVHPAPRDVAIIGLGSGDTAWAAACRQETATVSVFEIAGPQSRLLGEFARRHDPPHLRRLLADPRLTIAVADGRRAVEASALSYDLIEADALRPTSAYSGTLYSVEFFERMSKRLKPGGLLCTWSPTPRVRATFRRALPHVLEFDGGSILVGSRDPIAVEPETWRARLRDPRVVAHLGEESAREVDTRLGYVRVAPVRPTFPAELNRDLFPRDEYQTPGGPSQ